MRGPERLDVGDGAEPCEAIQIVGVDHLEVGEMVAVATPPMGLDGCLDRVQGLAHPPVAQRVEVDLEVVGVELGDVRAQGDGVDEAQTRVGGGAAAAVEVGGGHGRREVLGDAVLHDLHRTGPEPSVAQLLSLGQQIGDLLGPRSRSHHRAPVTRAVSVPSRAAAR